MKKYGTKSKSSKLMTGICPECGKKNCTCTGIAKGAKKAKKTFKK